MGQKSTTPGPGKDKRRSSSRQNALVPHPLNRLPAHQFSAGILKVPFDLCRQFGKGGVSFSAGPARRQRVFPFYCTAGDLKGESPGPEGNRFFHVVGDEDNRFLRPPPDLFQFLLELFPGLKVQGGKGSSIKRAPG